MKISEWLTFAVFGEMTKQQLQLPASKRTKAIDIYTPNKAKRNAKCPCGSGHKYKKCCGVRKRD